MGAFLNYCLLMDVLIVTFKNSSLPAHIDHVIGSSSFGYNPTTISAHHQPLLSSQKSKSKKKSSI